MKKDINIEKLIVNPENYRFDPVDNQNEAIDLMMEEKGDEIFNLAKHILDRGLDKAKDSRVLETKKGFFLVLDGNRRTTALKCLHQPSLVKDKELKNKFLKILKGNKEPIGEVNCFVYQNEKDAAEWIKLDHTGKNSGVGQDPWGAAEKDRFDYKFSGKISPAMQTVDLFQQKTKEIVDTKALKISTINRILSNPESRSYLGIDINKGQVILTAAEEDVIPRLGKLFAKIISDDTTVASVYHTPDAIKFMKDLFKDKPKLRSQTEELHPGKEKTSEPSKKSLPKSTNREFLIPKNCIFIIPEKKINNIYRELRDDLLLNDSVKAVPNAVGVLFRVFLEVTLDFYISKCGISLKKDTKLAGKITKVADDMENKKIADKTQLQNIRRVAIAKTSILSIDNFNEYVHSFKTQPSPNDLKIKWDNLQEFFEILWEYLCKNLKSRKNKR